MRYEGSIFPGMHFLYNPKSVFHETQHIVVERVIEESSSKVYYKYFNSFATQLWWCGVETFRNSVEPCSEDGKPQWFAATSELPVKTLEERVAALEAKSVANYIASDEVVASVSVLNTAKSAADQILGRALDRALDRNFLVSNHAAPLPDHNYQWQVVDQKDGESNVEELTADIRKLLDEVRASIKPVNPDTETIYNQILKIATEISGDHPRKAEHLERLVKKLKNPSSEHEAWDPVQPMRCARCGKTIREGESTQCPHPSESVLEHRGNFNRKI